MKKEIATRWIEALRSGDYKQGRGWLRNGKNEFCCLGVLCNLHAQAHPEIAEKQTDRGSYMGRSGVLPEEVQFWAGMTDENPTVPGSVMTLAAFNDGGYNFDKIANIIEKNWKGL